MFGVVRPCRHRLRGGLFGAWTAHLCGLCLTLRSAHGQLSRLVTNYDGLLVSVITEAQNPAVSPHRVAGPCALRGFRTAEVVAASASGAQLAASVSLLLAAGKIRDHVADRDGAYARTLIAGSAGFAASRWQAAGERVGARIGFDTSVLTQAVARQAGVERASGLGLADVTEPTETAVSAAFAHTAVLADRPGNAEPLAGAGRQFGRIAHLLDAVQDLADDTAAGAYNPLLATGTTLTQARAHCGTAVSELRRSVGSLELDRPALAQALLVGEVAVAVDRVFERVAGGAWPTGPGEGSPTGPAVPPGSQQDVPVDPFQPSPWHQSGNPSRFSGRRGGSCCDAMDCCGSLCEAVGDCDCGGCDCSC